MTHPSIQGTLLRLSHHYPDAKDLLRAVREAHPDASKKDVTLAALDIIIEAAGSQEGLLRHLHQRAKNEG